MSGECREKADGVQMRELDARARRLVGDYDGSTRQRHQGSLEAVRVQFSGD